MGLEAKQAGAHAPKQQQAVLYPSTEIQPNRGHVADDLVLGLLEGKIDRSLAASTRGVAEVRGERGLARACGPADQYRAPPKRAFAAEHRIKAVNTGRDPLAGYRMLKTQRCDRLYGDPVLADQERVLVGPVKRAAVLQNAQTPRRGLFRDEMIQHDHAVRDVLLDSATGQHPVAALAR